MFQEFVVPSFCLALEELNIYRCSVFLVTVQGLFVVTSTSHNALNPSYDMYTPLHKGTSRYGTVLVLFW